MLLYTPCGCSIAPVSEVTGYHPLLSAPSRGNRLFLHQTSSYVWGISQARDWLSVASNRRGNPLTVMGRAMDDIGDDMSKSPSNFLRDVVSTGTVVALAPLSALLLIL